MNAVSQVVGVKQIIAVASGKGGVGKSTVAVNLALALLAEGGGQGCRVGLLDADIYGPSQPLMLGVDRAPEMRTGAEGQRILEPIVQHNIQSMSIGYLIDVDTPMIWRGPMVSAALQQLLYDTHWDNLDYLVIDLPPGTGDIQLTLSQKIPVNGVVIVTTPQDIALLDARKAVAMFQKVRIPVLGVVENMSTHICQHCGHADPIFGEGGGERIAAQYHIDLLGRLPLDIQIREQTDKGKPTVVADPAGAIALEYRSIARQVVTKLNKEGLRTTRFPKITIEK